jgi:hypothetical protein
VKVIAPVVAASGCSKEGEGEEIFAMLVQLFKK